MKRLLKDNLSLTIGAALPISLLIVFYLAAIFPKIVVKSPTNDLLYLITPYPHDGILTEVKDSTLKIWITPEVRKGKLAMPRLFRFSAQTQTSTEIPISLPAASGMVTGDNREELIIPDVQHLKIDPQVMSPDGYKAEILFPQAGSLIKPLLLNTKRTLVILKDGNIIHVSDEKNNRGPYHSIQFIGWIHK